MARWANLVDARAGLGLLLCAVIVISVVQSAIAAPDRAITSDESLYLAEAVSIANSELEYSSGQPIVHRPPLYPATLSPAFAWGDGIRDARWIALAYGLGIVAAVYALTRSLFGAVEGLAAATIAAAAGTPRMLAGSFFLDGPATMWLLLSICCVMQGRRSGGISWMVLSGVLLGVSFLTKETAVFWLPLPLLLMTFERQSRLSLGQVAAHGFAFSICVLPWFGWVYWHTGEIYKLGRVGAFDALIAIIAILLTMAVLAAGRRLGGRYGRAAFAVVLLAWMAASLCVLESRPEPHAIDYARSVPTWVATVLLPSMQPWPLILAAWGWLFRRAAHLNDAAPVLGITVALGMPMHIFAANAGWEPRQVAWLIYLGYAVLGWAAVDLLPRVAGGRANAGLAAVSVVAALAMFAGVGGSWRDAEAEPSAVRDWRGDEERIISSWFDGVPDGSTVLASRLFHSQLFVDQGGRIHWEQLPTLGVTIDETGRISPFGSMFRYDDAGIDLKDDRSWLWLAKYENRPYYVCLAREDLNESLAQRAPDYLLIVGDDAGFSSALIASLASEQPSLRLVKQHEGNVRAYLFEVNGPMRIADRPGTLLRGDDLAQIATDAGEPATTPAFWEQFAPAGIRLDGEAALMPADLAALSSYYVNGEE